MRLIRDIMLVDHGPTGDLPCSSSQERKVAKAEGPSLKLRRTRRSLVRLRA